MKGKVIIFFFFLLLSIVFFLISLLTWNLVLGACSFVIAISLTRYLDFFGISKEGEYSHEKTHQ